MKTRWLILLLALTLHCQGGEKGDYLGEPKILLKIVAALENSGIQELTSRKPAEENHSYHLGTAEFLGTILRDGTTYAVARAFYLRSSSPDRVTPPARGHEFIVVFDPRWKIAGYGRVEMGYYYLNGAQLLFRENQGEESRVVADFGSKSPKTHYGGFPMLNMPYPFPDRISEEDWKTGSYDQGTR